METITSSKNICLGVIEDYVYTSDTITLQKGDSIITFTDGVTEACSTTNDLFGETRLEALLPTLSGETAKGLVDKVLQAVHAHAEGAEQSDDITMLTIKRQ